MAKTKNKPQETEPAKVTKLPCGCIYQDKGWMLLRINECERHHQRRTTKRPYKPKAECVKP
ncbi:MAG: hypothetical protein LBQ98_06990 [Nitrososphaerota archaeon]|jgi:hypothetical protein|nr:hypothetical protein [Nitrososphaerota archaeon]